MHNTLAVVVRLLRVCMEMHAVAWSVRLLRACLEVAWRWILTLNVLCLHQVLVLADLSCNAGRYDCRYSLPTLPPCPRPEALLCPGQHSVLLDAKHPAMLEDMVNVLVALVSVAC